jgi:putative flippase GtrA
MLHATPGRPSTIERVLRFLRAGLAGLAATLVDLAVLAVLVSGLHVDARVASLPALVLGGVANFIGNRHFAFRAQGGSFGRQAMLYAVVEVAALAMNGLLYDLALRVIPGATHAYVLVRVCTSHIVFLCWSYPLWRWVFRVPARGEGTEERVEEADA